VHAKLSLLRSSIRTSSLASLDGGDGDAYRRKATGDDARFRDFAGAIQSIVTSTAQHDAGLFEVNLRDERYLPFEGAGAISTWRIELPNDVPQFDFETISDVVLHLRYTAREAGHLRAAASATVKAVLGNPGTLLQLFCLNHDFGDAWQRFRGATGDATRQLSITFDRDRLPYWATRLDVGDALVATFAVIDWSKNQLIVAPATLALGGSAQSGWTLSVTPGDAQAAPVLAFLTKYKDARIYMAVSRKP